MTKNSNNQDISGNIERLEEIVKKLENPKLTLEERIKLLEVGALLHKECRKKLTEANTKIKEILEIS